MLWLAILFSFVLLTYFIYCFISFCNQGFHDADLLFSRYWFLDYPDLDAKMLANVQKLYSMAVAVPFFSKFVVFAKRLSRDEGRLRIFCMTDDKVDKTLERQEQFVEVARSDDVEVLFFADTIVFSLAVKLLTICCKTPFGSFIYLFF